MIIKDVIDILEEFAPLAYQESYDNSGLLVGDSSEDVRGILICLDSTEEVVEEAISKKCNLIIAHHPIVFSGLKSFTGKTYIERVVMKAIQNNIAIYACHTNLDSVINGVNGKIAEKLDLINLRILRPKNGILKKLYTYCPIDHVDNLRAELANTGAGSIGEYSECSFNTVGKGTFKAGSNSKPFVGKVGELHTEEEVKLEMIFPTHLESKVLSTLFKSHPYEEVAYEIITLDNQHQNIGSGIIGEMKREIDEQSFLKLLKNEMTTTCIKHTRLLGKKIKTVAICGGSGSFLLEDAIAKKADIFITADFKYHQFFDAEHKIIIADIGHYESEQYTKQLLYGVITKKNLNFATYISNINTNPINYYF